MVESGPDADIKPGNALPLANIPVGTVIHNIELQPGKGGQMVRSAGGAAQLMAKEGAYGTVRLPSGEYRMVLQTCRATVGQVGNVEHENIVIGKAGRSRHLGIRPHVRGVAMNPVDHPTAAVKVRLRWVGRVRQLLGARLPAGCALVRRSTATAS